VGGLGGVVCIQRKINRAKNTPNLHRHEKSLKENKQKKEVCVGGEEEGMLLN